MNGRTPPTAAPPPSSQMPPHVQRARQAPHRAATGFRVTRIVGVLLVVALLGLGAAWIIFRTEAKTVATAVESTILPAWRAQKAQGYPPPEPPPPVPPAKPPVDTVTPELARLRAEMLAMQQKLDEMDKRKAAAPVVPPHPPAAPKPPAPKPSPAPMLYVAHTLQEEGGAVNKEPTYTLLPGGYIPCLVETGMNSDTGDIPLVAVVSTTVYDTATGRVPLILQGSKLVGEGQGSQLLPGNERIRTVSLTLSRRQDKVPIDLGTAPVTDQAGVAGLTGRVNNHTWRLIGAVFIGGALRGGTQAIQTAIVGSSPVGQVGGGIAQTGNQVVTSQTSRALDTRPTIDVDGGQLCSVILTKPLALTMAR